MAIDFDKLEDSPQLIDYLLQMEDVLDSLDLYVYRNWLEGEVIEGPMVRRHWVSMTLVYPHTHMPDPRAAMRLLKHGVRVDFSKVRCDAKGGFAATGSADADTDLGAAQGATSPVGSAPARPGGETAGAEFWMVRLEFPRRLLGQMNAAEVDYYEDEVEMDDVEDAQDSGVTDESAYTDEGQQQGNDPAGDGAAAAPTADAGMAGPPGGELPAGGPPRG